MMIMCWAVNEWRRQLWRRGRISKDLIEALTPAFQDEEQEVTMLLFFFDP